MSTDPSKFHVIDENLLDFDKTQGIVEQFFEQDGQWVTTQTQDATSLIELNKAQYNAHDERGKHNDEVFNKAASIPLVLYMELERKGIIKDEKAFRRWLDDPDNRHFRTRPGRLSR